MFIEPDFVNVPYVYSASPETFRSLFNSAKTESVEMILFDDSQGTNAGFGDKYLARFNYKLNLTYRNSPGTPWVALNSSTGGGAPYCDWMVQTKVITTNGPAASRIPNNKFLPGTRGTASSLIGSSVVNPSEFYGQMLVLRHDASEINPGANVPVGINFMDISQGAYLDIIAGTNISSGEVKFNIRPSNILSYFAPITHVGISTMGLENNNFSMKSETFGPFTWTGPKYLQAELFGSSATKQTDIIAARFRSAADARGIILSSLSVGGYSSFSLESAHSDSGGLLRAMNPDVVAFGYGANDSGFLSPQQFKEQMLENIDWVREWAGPETLIILITDPYRLGSAQLVSNIENYPRVLYEIATEDSGVLLINSMRKLYDQGWNLNDLSPYLVDVVHYTAYGSRLKADTEVSMIVDEFMCKVDFNNDNFVDFFDYDQFVVEFAGNSRFCDYNGDEFIDFFDYDAFVTAFEEGC